MTDSQGGRQVSQGTMQGSVAEHPAWHRLEDQLQWYDFRPRPRREPTKALRLGTGNPCRILLVEVKRLRQSAPAGIPVEDSPFAVVRLPTLRLQLAQDFDGGNIGLELRYVVVPDLFISSRAQRV